MKKHAIIPVFISHRGCPNDCVFCNQKKITARNGDVTPKDAEKTIEQWLTTLRPEDGSHPCETVEVSFFGGSFTGLSIEEQTDFLKLAYKYKEQGKVDMIHLSTRPDYINREILDNLKQYGVDVIELGVQSFDDKVLLASGRGHDSRAIYSSCKLIKEYGFSLGIQLMIGLPGDSLESCIYSAEETVKLRPELARLYPTVTIRETELYEMYLRGEYEPLCEEEAIKRTKAMYEIIDDAGINIIRVGLKSSDIMSEEIGFHPAFRQLVESEIARDRIEKQIVDILDEECPDWEYFGGVDDEVNAFRINLVALANEKCYGNMFGHKGKNRLYFDRTYPMISIRYAKDYEEMENLKDNQYLIRPDVYSGY